LTACPVSPPPGLGRFAPKAAENAGALGGADGPIHPPGAGCPPPARGAPPRPPPEAKESGLVVPQMPPSWLGVVLEMKGGARGPLAPFFRASPLVNFPEIAAPGRGGPLGRGPKPWLSRERRGPKLGNPGGPQVKAYAPVPLSAGKLGTGFFCSGRSKPPFASRNSPPPAVRPPGSSPLKRKNLPGGQRPC